MGMRGPGAKAKGWSKLPPFRRARKPSWNREGLSRADRVIRFVQSLKITAGKGAGRKFRLREWQRRIIRGIYGPSDERGRRRIRQALITMPRKNGKTELAAALALCHLVGPEAEPRGQVYSAASDRDQAAIIFAELEAFISADPALTARCNVQRFAKKIEDLETGSVYAALSSDARKAHGLGPSFFVGDELAQWHGRELFDNLITGQGAREAPLSIVISTQSSDPNSVMSELVDYARQIDDGIIDDPSFYSCIYAAPDDADPWSETVWRACNPALGDFRSLDEMRDAARKAKRIPAREAAFRNLYLNQRVDADPRFIAAADWNANAGAVDPDALHGQACYGGLDLGATQDLTALALYFPDSGAVLAWFWLPGDDLADREERDHVPYRLWRDQGFLETWPGRATDKRAIAGRLAAIAGTYDVAAIAYDRWRMADLRKLLDDEGIDLPLREFGQGFVSMAPAVDAAETLILDAKLKHGGNPILRWNAANAVVQLDPTGGRKLAKNRSIGRIDGLVALVMAIGIASRESGGEIDLGDRPLVISA